MATHSRHGGETPLASVGASTNPPRVRECVQCIRICVCVCVCVCVCGGGGCARVCVCEIEMNYTVIFNLDLANHNRLHPMFRVRKLCSK